MGVQSTLLGTAAGVAGAAVALKGKEKKPAKAAAKKPAANLANEKAAAAKSPSAVAADKAKASLAEHTLVKRDTVERTKQFHLRSSIK